MIRCLTDIDKVVANVKMEAEKLMISAFKRAGALAVEKIKQTKTYKDVTFKLTSSIGYGVVWNGQLIEEGGFGNGEGGEKGRTFLHSLVSGVPYGLIIVAGMDYALYVERKGYVVLDGGTLDIGKDIKDYLEKQKIQ